MDPATRATVTWLVADLKREARASRRAFPGGAADPRVVLCHGVVLGMVQGRLLTLAHLVTADDPLAPHLRDVAAMLAPEGEAPLQLPFAAPAASPAPAVTPCPAGGAPVGVSSST